MDNQDINRFKSIIAALGDYYEKTISPNVTALYWQDFKGYSIEVFEKAVSDHRKDPDQGMFFPKAAHLMRQIEGTSKDKQNQQEAKAQRIWSDLVNHLRLRGHRIAFKVDDGAALDALQAMGGMAQLNLIETKNLEWEGKKFIKLYADNLDSCKSVEGGYLSIATKESLKRLESDVVKPEPVYLPPEETRKMIDGILGRSSQGKTEPKITTDETEKMKAEAIRKAKDHLIKNGGDK